MGKTRGLRKYRRKSKQVKKHVKRFSKKSRKHATNHKKNKQTVKRRQGVKNRRSRRIARGGMGSFGKKVRTLGGLIPDVKELKPSKVWERGKEYYLQAKAMPAQEFQTFEKDWNNNKIILTMLFNTFDIEISNGETLLQILRKLYAKLSQSNEIFLHTGLTGEMSYMLKTKLVEMIEEIIRALTLDYGDTKIELNIASDNMSDHREHVAEMISNYFIQSWKIFY